MSELTRELVMELRKIVRRERIDGTTAEQLSAELSALADHWLATHVCETCGGSGGLQFLSGNFDGEPIVTRPCPSCTPRAGTDEGGGRL